MKQLTVLITLSFWLCLSSLHAQFVDTTLYDFKDGSIITNTKSDDGKLTLTGSYSHHGTSYGLNMKANSQIKIAVDGACTVKFLGSVYSSLSMSAATASGAVVTPELISTTVVNDKVDTYEFIHTGFADTLIFTATGDGSDVYLPQIEVFTSGTTYDFTDGNVVTNGKSDDGSLTLTGSYSYHSASYGLNMKKDAQIKVAVSGSCLIKFLGSKYSSLSLSAVTTDGTALEPAELSTLVENDLSDTYEFSYTGFADTLTFTATGEGSDVYLPLMEVILTTPPASYDFRDGNIITNTKSDDGKLILNGSYSHHGTTYGLNMKADASIDIIVDGSCTIRFLGSTYSSLTMSAISKSGIALNPSEISTFVENDLVDYYEFTFPGEADTLTFTATGDGSDVYLPLIEVIPGEIKEVVYVSDGLIDVWDFGAEALDAAVYDNQLTEEIINAWYDESITVGTSGNVLPAFTVGDLSWVGGTNDRLRTSNTNLTRYDESLGGATGYTGRVYVNGAAATSRYMSLTLREDDEVTLAMLSQNGSGVIHFTYASDPSLQDDVINVGTEVTDVTFIAQYAGEYQVYDSQDKPSYFRIARKDAEYITITGAIDVSAAAGISTEYTVIYENEVGKTWVADMGTNEYSIKVPAGHTYEVSLGDANGYIINSGNSIEVTSETTTFDLTIEAVELYTVSGTITGLNEEISNLTLAYKADPEANKIFIPQPVINTEAGTYTVQLEPSCEYTIEAIGINDFYAETSTITIGAADETSNIVFLAKPVYKVTITAPELSAAQLEQLALTFTNLNEEGYIYSFTSVADVKLRDGVYTMDYSGLDLYPIQLGATSNLTINGADVSKELLFAPINIWSFNDKAIASGDTAYNGLLFTGGISSQLAKGHLVGKPEATIKVPVTVGQKIKASFYYAANFYIVGGDTASTTSGSTSNIEYIEYSYTGTEDGFVTLVFGEGTSYLTEIAAIDVIEYSPTISVGTDKDYQTINAALTAIEKMSRPENERVTVLIDPGNYEEMLVVNVKNITLKNAAETPGIGLANKGVEIEDNAVRVTSYYGHGYNYFSMGADQKWSADALRVNSENGYIPYENTGSGSTNGSYWNATVVIFAEGFEADHIIFENSFNQYISTKESEDIVVEWTSGGKGVRPTDAGNSAVQGRSFVERAAAIAFAGSADKAVLYNCRVVGRQDSFYGNRESRIVIYKGAVMGAVDYLFGGMTAVFYKSDLVMNVSDDSNDRSYLTAAQQDGGRGYLMYECTVTSAEPGTETASEYRAKPGYFGRPWQANTSEVVFYNTTIETSNNPSYDGESLIMPEGWTSSLGGESPSMYEYGTIELSGADNSASRASWTTMLSVPTLSDDTEITSLNFTKGDDGWDPLPDLIANDNIVGVSLVDNTSSITISTSENLVSIENITTESQVSIYNLNGSMVNSFTIEDDSTFSLEAGFWIVRVNTGNEQQVAKIITQ